jgi:DNA integrity scanning protein DisA with diadenylate cyclase activity
MLRIENANKANKMYVTRKYRIEVVIGTPEVYFFQLKHIVNSNVLIAQLNRVATAKGKYRLKLNNKSDYLTIKELNNPMDVRDRIKQLIKC